MNPTQYQAAVAQRESGGDPNAQNPNGSAAGLYGFTAGTWQDLMQRHPDLGLTADGRMDAGQQGRAMSAFTADNASVLKGAGIDPTPSALYAAHFLGAHGSVPFLEAAANSPQAPATEFVSRDAASANRNVFFNDDGTPKSVADVMSKFPGAAPPDASAPSYSLAQLKAALTKAQDAGDASAVQELQTAISDPSNYSRSDLMGAYDKALDAGDPKAVTEIADAYQSKRQDWNRSSIYSDPLWQKNARLLYQAWKGKAFDGSDKDAADWLMGALDQFRYSNFGMADTTQNILRNFDQKSKLAFLTSLDAANAMPNFTGAGTIAALKGMAGDPTTYAGVGLVADGLKGLGLLGGKAAASDIGAAVIRKSILGALAKGAVKGAVIGGGLSSANDAANQAINVSAGTQDAFDPGQLGVSAAAGATIGGLLGGPASAASHLAAGSDLFTSMGVRDAQAAGRLSARLKADATASGLDLANVDREAPRGAAVALDNASNAIQSEINGFKDVLRPQLATDQASSFDNLMQRIQANAGIKDGFNKVKGIVGDDELSTLNNLVGKYAEGQKLIDTLKESNELTALARQGTVGGLSRYTDMLAPFGKPSRYLRGGGENLGTLALATTGFTGHPILAATQLGAWGGGRALDALTGMRSRVGKFVKLYGAEPAVGADISGLPSIVAENAAKQQSAADAAAAKQQAILDQQARGAAFRKEMRMNDQVPLGGFDNLVYNQTGLKPSQQEIGLMRLVSQGHITGDEFNQYLRSPEDLMAGNLGNHIIDRLHVMANDGVLTRDPEWVAARQPNPAEPMPAAGTAETYRYQAQAQGNQARVTAAINSVSRASPDPVEQTAIARAIAAIGRSNNKQKARQIANELYAFLKDPEGAKTLIDPLITQIRHATPVDAAEAVRPK